MIVILLVLAVSFRSVKVTDMGILSILYCRFKFRFEFMKFLSCNNECRLEFCFKVVSAIKVKLVQIQIEVFSTFNFYLTQLIQ